MKLTARVGFHQLNDVQHVNAVGKDGHCGATAGTQFHRLSTACGGFDVTRIKLALHLQSERNRFRFRIPTNTNIEPYHSLQGNIKPLRRG